MALSQVRAATRSVVRSEIFVDENKPNERDPAHTTHYSPEARSKQVENNINGIIISQMDALN